MLHFARLGLALLLTASCHLGPLHASASPVSATTDAGARAVTELESVAAFAQLYGYVRFFHPSDAAAAASWQKLAATGAAFVAPARSVAELRARLHHVFSPFAPTLVLWTDGQEPPSRPAALRRVDEPVYWQYQGFPGTALTVYTPPYRARRVGSGDLRAFAEVPAFDACLRTRLAPGLNVQLPLILPKREASADVLAAPSGLDEAVGELARRRDGFASIHVRRGAVIEVWNVLRHFYPYQEVVDAKWPRLLLRTLADAEDDATVADMRTTLRRLVHEVNDGHGDVDHPVLQQAAVLPFRMELIEGRAVVTGTHDPGQFRVGEVVETIAGVAVRPLIERVARELSGSPQWRTLRAGAWEVVRGVRGDAVDVAVRGRDGTRVEHTRYAYADPASTPHPDPITRFEDGVFYVDLTRTQWSDIAAKLEDIAVAPGVVFDMRGYPGHVDRIIDHLLRDPEDAKWMHVPRIMEPNGEIVAWYDLGWDRRPSEPRIAGKAVFLVSADAISYAESILSYVESHDLGVLIGSASAGANGDIVRLDTLSQFFVIFTGMRVTRHNGAPFHTEGVKPDIAVERTIAGLQAGVDEVLEAGLLEIRHSLVDQTSTEQAARTRNANREPPG